MRLLVFFPALCAALCLGCAGAVHDPGLVSFGGALGNRYVPAGAPSQIVARLVVTAAAEPKTERRPLNLALVIDTSGSMEGRPIADARAASLRMIDALRGGDRLAIITFDAKVDVVLPSTEMGSSARTKARAAVNGLTARGTTDLEGGLRAAIAEVEERLDPTAINRIVLMSDGVPNSQTLVRPLAARAGRKGITVTSLGLGPEYDETLMGAIAQLSGGKFHYVEESSKVAVFFRNEVLRMDGAVARNATLELTPGPGVTIQDVVGQPVEAGGGGVRLRLGDLTQGDRRDIIVRLSVSAHRAGAIAELLDAELGFHDKAGSDVLFERRAYLGARATSSNAELLSGRDRAVEDAAALIQASASTLKAIELVRKGDVAGAQRAFDFADEGLETQANASGNPIMRRRADSLKSLQRSLPPPNQAAAPQAPSVTPPMLKAHDAAMQDLQ